MSLNWHVAGEQATKLARSQHQEAGAGGCPAPQSGKEGQQGEIERGRLIGDLAGGGTMRVDAGMSWHGQQGVRGLPSRGFAQQESRPDEGGC